MDIITAVLCRTAKKNAAGGLDITGAPLGSRTVPALGRQVSVPLALAFAWERNEVPESVAFKVAVIGPDDKFLTPSGQSALMTLPKRELAKGELAIGTWATDVLFTPVAEGRHYVFIAPENQDLARAIPFAVVVQR